MPWTRPYPAAPVRGSVAAAVSGAGQLVGVAGAQQPVRRRVGRVDDLDPHRALEVGPQQQVGPGVGLDPGDAPGLLGVERLGRAEVLGGDVGTSGPQHAVGDLDPGASRRSRAAPRAAAARAAVTTQATAPGTATTSASQRLATSIVPCAHQRSGTLSRSRYDAGVEERSGTGPSLAPARPSPRGHRVPDVLDIAARAPRPRPAAAGVRPSRRRRRRPAHHRRRRPSRRGSGPGADRHRARRCPRGTSRWCTRARAWPPATGCPSSTPRHHRRRLPRRDQGAAGQPRPARAGRAAARRPDRPAGGPARRAGPLRRGRRTARLACEATGATVLPEASGPRPPIRASQERSP